MHQLSLCISCRITLLCGVIPGCPNFVQQDFSLVGNDGDLLSIYGDNGLVARIVVPDGKRRLYAKRRFVKGVYLELIMLLCPFLPLHGSSVSKIQFPPWPMRNQCVLVYWEGGYALMKGLETRLQEYQGNSTSLILSRILKYFKKLEQNYFADFYCRFSKAAVINRMGISKKIALLADCREIYNYTTNALQQFGQSTSVQPYNVEHSDRTPYLHLVAAHFCMSLEATQEATNKIEAQIRAGKDRSQATLRRNVNSIRKFHPLFKGQ